MFTDAEAYDGFMGGWSAALADPFLDAAGLGRPSVVLDVGSGTGNLAFAVARRWPLSRVVGIEPSAGFVEAATARSPDASRVRFEQAGADDVPLGADAVDAALSLLVLNFVPDPERAVAEMSRVTRPGGVVAAAVWDYGGGMRPLRLFWDAVVHHDPSAAARDEATMPLVREGELVGLWSAAGLRGIRSGAVEVARRYELFEDYWAPFLLGTGPAGAHVASLPERDREALREDLAARVGTAPFDLTARAWWVRGLV